MAMNTHKNVTVQGKVTTKDGGPAPGLTVAVMLLDYLPLGVGYEVASAVTDANGKYSATFDPSKLGAGGADEQAAALHVRVGTGTEVGSKEVFGHSGVFLAEAVADGGAILDAVVPADWSDPGSSKHDPVAKQAGPIQGGLGAESGAAPQVHRAQSRGATTRDTSQVLQPGSRMAGLLMRSGALALVVGEIRRGTYDSCIDDTLLGTLQRHGLARNGTVDWDNAISLVSDPANSWAVDEILSRWAAEGV